MSTATVMIVDDDPDARELLGVMLCKRGYRVVSAAGGAEALDQLRDGARPDVIILDLMMPGMDGPQLAARLREDRALAQIPIVVLSADPQLRAKADDIGAVGALQKPARMSQLIDYVDRCVNGDGAHSSA